ncbi:hypothetical protein [Rubritalea tangerina]|uniref:SLA1 homology domain-containing protein n=1 Tax=Rubritalea tangerina TaxID=430798 RepID=A0ABW4ZA99_9BACT
MNSKLLVLASATSLLLGASLQARTWTSSDGMKTFEASFKSYDSETKQVTVIRKYKNMKFALDVLSEADQKWVKQKVAEETKKKELQDAPSITEQLAEQVVGRHLTDKTLSRLEGKRFVKAQLEKVPEYYILYFTASW